MGLAAAKATLSLTANVVLVSRNLQLQSHPNERVASTGRSPGTFVLPESASVTLLALAVQGSIAILSEQKVWCSLRIVVLV